MAEIDDIEVEEEDVEDSKSKLIEISIYTITALVFLVIAYLLVNSFYPNIYKAQNLQKPDKNVTNSDQPEAEYELLELKTVVNPRGSGANRFLSVKVAINPLIDFSADFGKYEPKLTSLTGEYFAGKTVEELAEVKNRIIFKEELKSKLNKYMSTTVGNNLVYDLYFVQFIMQ